MHIGLIGGIGVAAAEFYYRGLVRIFEEAQQTLELTIVHADVHELLRNLLAGEAEKQAEVFKKFAGRLQAAGADIAVVTSLGGHFCNQEFERVSPLPVGNALPILDTYFLEHQIKKIGVLGTRAVMASRLYGGVTSAEIVAPEGDELDATHDNYVSMALGSHATEQHRQFFFETGAKLIREQGADAVLLGGTDLCLAFDGRHCGFPVIDGAQVHLEGIAKEAMKHG